LLSPVLNFSRGCKAGEAKLPTTSPFFLFYIFIRSQAPVYFFSRSAASSPQPLFILKSKAGLKGRHSLPNGGESSCSFLLETLAMAALLIKRTAPLLPPTILFAGSFAAG